MNTQGHRCGQCGGALAPADSVCAACGQAVAPEQRLALLGARAEALAADGLHAQAARAAGTLLGLPLAPADAKLWRRKRAVWLQRAGEPGALAAAELDLREAVRLDDGDDLGHQLWCDLLRRQGRLEEARAEYQKRLDADPQDAVARRQLASLRLMEDLKAAPVPKLNLPKGGDGGLIMNAIRPTPYKMFMAGIAVLFCLIALFSAGNSRAAAASLSDGTTGLGPILKLAEDPWINTAQLVVYCAYLAWGLKTRPWRKS